MAPPRHRSYGAEVMSQQQNHCAGDCGVKGGRAGGVVLNCSLFRAPRLNLAVRPPLNSDPTEPYPHTTVVSAVTSKVTNGYAGLAVLLSSRIDLLADIAGRCPRV